MRMLIYFFTVSFIINTHAGQKPNWVHHHPTEDTEYKYYIGRNMETTSEDMAFTLATINAREQAISQNFGVFTQIRTETYQNMDQALSTQNVHALSQQVQLEEFEQVDYYKENLTDSKNKINFWILFKYKKSAIQKEKQRISIFKESLTEKFSVLKSGNEENAKISGTLEVTSEPLGAPVRVDGRQKIGDLELRSPLKLLGLFTSGKHIIEIDHPHYEPIQQEIILYPGLTAKVEAKLKRAYGKVQITTNIEGATIFIGAKLIGHSPIEKMIDILAGTTANIEIRHPEMHTFSTQVQVKRNETVEVYANLVPLDSFIAISSDPASANIEIDGKKIITQTPSGPIKINMGVHHVKIYKKGYKSIEYQIEVKGGETKILPHSILTRQKKSFIKGLNHFAGSTITLNNQKINSPEVSMEFEPGNYFLSVQKLGYYDFSKTFNLEEGDTIDFSNEELKRIPENHEKLFNPIFSISLALLSVSSPSNNKKGSILALGGGIRIQPFSRLGIDFSYLFDEETIEGTGITNTTPNTMITDVYRIGLPITIYRPEVNMNDAVNIIPEYMKSETEFINKGTGGNNKPTKTKFPNMTEKQQGKGLSLEYRIFTEPKKESSVVYGFSARAGAFQFSNQDNIKSALSVSTGFEFIIGF